MAKTKYKQIRMTYDSTPSLSARAAVALFRGAETVATALSNDVAPAAVFEMQRALVKALVAEANSGRFSLSDSEAIYRAAECLGRRDVQFLSARDRARSLGFKDFEG